MKQFPRRSYCLCMFSLTVLVCSFASYARSGVRSGHLIDSHGKQIPSIFFDTPANFTYALEAIRNKPNSGPCKMRDALYRPSDRIARVVQVSCGSHYFSEGSSICGQPCGGYESTTYSDPFADYCTGYEFDNDGCEAGCRETVTCVHELC
jgi:hypothetical protein